MADNADVTNNAGEKPLPNLVPKAQLYPGLQTQTIQEIDGVLYQPARKTTDFVEALQAVKRLNLKSDDIVTVGFPRCGSHWAFEVVDMIMREDPTYTDRALHRSLMEFMGPNVQDTLDALESPRRLYTHLRLRQLPDDVLKKGVKVIYLVRNPKDAINSYYKLVSLFKLPKYMFTGTFDDFLKAHMAGKYPFGKWMDHILDADKFIKEYPECQVYIHSFENMKERPIEAIGNLCKFLGKPVKLAESIAKTVEFANFQKKTKAKMDEVSKKAFHAKDFENKIIRKGEISDWKNIFTVAQSEEFNREFEAKMSGCDLADYVRKYI